MAGGYPKTNDLKDDPLSKKIQGKNPLAVSN